MDDSSAEDVARFFDREACCASPAHGSSPGRLRGASRVLMDLLDEAGISGRTVFDAGSGQGGLAIAVARGGAADVTGIDLSPASVAAAQRTAERAGVGARFLVGNAATTSIEPHDVVVLNKVVCCYFDADTLLANTLPAARSFVAMALPRSRGVRGALARLLLAAENTWRRLRRDAFRAYLHDETAISSTLARNGLSPALRRDHWMWHIAVWQRPA